MAVSVKSQYLQVGPRQGVYIRPDRLPVPRQLGTAGPPFHGDRVEWCGQLSVLPAPLKWKRLQFKNPSESYKYRARVEPPHPPSPYGSGVQALTAFREVSRPKLGRPIPTRSSSCTNLHQCIPRPPSGGRQPRVEHTRSLSFNITAQAVVMQPRPPQRIPARERSLIGEQPYSYPDPTSIKGNVAFDIRISELTRLQSDTVRYEESMQRIYGNLRRNQHNSKTVGRPTSAREPQKRFAPQAVHRQSLPGVLDRGSGATPRPGLLTPQYYYPGTQNQSGRSKRPRSANCRYSSDVEAPDQTTKGLYMSAYTSNLHRRIDSERSRPSGIDRNSEVSETRVVGDDPQGELASPANLCASGISIADSSHKDTPPKVVLSGLNSSEAKEGNQENVGEQTHLLDRTCKQNDSSLEDNQASPEVSSKDSLPLERQNGARNTKEQAGETRSKRAKAKNPGGRSHCSLKVDRVSSTTSVSSSTSQCGREKGKPSSQTRRRGGQKPTSRGKKSGTKE